MAFSQAQLELLHTNVELARQQATHHVHDKWREYYDYFNGDGQQARFDFSNARWMKDEFRIANLTYAAINTILPLLLDAAPEWFMVDDAGMLDDSSSQYMQAFYHRRHIRQELRPTFRDALTLGTGIIKAGYDPHIDEWGDVRVSWQDPFCVYPDPAATRLDKAEFIAILNEYSPAYAKKVFSGGDETPFAKIDIEKAEKKSPDNPSRPDSVRPEFEPGVEHLNVWEVYHDFGESLTIYSGDQVLFHGKNPVGPRWPLVFFHANPEMRNVWAPSEIKQYQPLQDTINLLRLRMLTAARLHASATTVVHGTPTSGAVTNEPNQVIQFSTPDGDVQKIPGPDLPQFIFALYGVSESDFDTVTGVHNVTRGQRPQGVQAGVAIQALQEAAQTRPRDLARDWRESFEELGQLIWDIGQMNYQQERILPMIQRGQSQVGRITMADLYTDTDEEGRRLTYENWRPRKMRCVVAIGGEQPLSPVARTEQATVLFQQGAIDAEALLDVINFPQRDKILQRMREKEAAAMGMQMQAAQMQAAQGAPGGPQASAEQQAGPQVQMSPEEAVQTLQMELSPEELARLATIREKVVMQAELDPEEGQFLDELIGRSDMLALAVETILTIEPEEYEEQQMLTNDTGLV